MALSHLQKSTIKKAATTIKEPQTAAALDSQLRIQLDVIEAFALSVTPDIKPKSLEAILADLSAAELEQLQQYGRMILNLLTPYSVSFFEQINRMYKNLDRGKQLLLAELLQRI